MRISHIVICSLSVIGGAVGANAMPNDPDTTPGGPRFCQQYASTTSNVVAGGLQQNPSCLDYGRGVHSNYQMHYDWCMRTPRTEVEGASMHIRDLVARCTGAPAPQKPRAAAPPPPDDGIGWTRASGGALAPGAIAAGRDTNGAALYVCSADFGGHQQPGKIRPGFDGCNFGMGGREMTSRTYSVMTGRSRWAPASDGRVPRNALQAGSETDGRELFVCRTQFNGSVQLGKVRPGFNGCNFGHGGREMTGNPYEVLY